MTEEERTIEQRDPDGGYYFGVPCAPEAARLVLVSAPWDVTAPAGAPFSYAPDAVIEASARMDLYDPLSPDEWRKGIATDDIDYTLQEISHSLRMEAERILAYAAKGGGLMDDYYSRRMRKVEEGCRQMVESVRSQSLGWLERGKIVGLVGGDRSVALALAEAAARHAEGMGILQLDSRCRLKCRHEGFEHSYDSLTYNVLERAGGVSRVVQAGQRVFSATEHRMAREDGRIALFGAERLSAMLFEGVSWREACDAVIGELPRDILVDFDMSVLSVEHCPHSPEAVAGGLGFDAVLYLLNRAVESGRRIVGFDLTGVAAEGERSVDAEAAARMLYRLCGLALRSQGE